MHKFSNENKDESIGISAIIIFIALVIIKGVATSVVLKTSTTLKS